jgi:hypothetical protein
MIFSWPFVIVITHYLIENIILFIIALLEKRAHAAAREKDGIRVGVGKHARGSRR